MSRNSEADNAMLVGLLAGMVRGEAAAIRLFEQPEFRASILAREARLTNAPLQTVPNTGSEPDPMNLSHWIAPPGALGGRNAIVRIREFLRGAERVTWCDPYLLGGNLSETFESPEHYADMVAGVLSGSVRHLRLFVPDRPRVPAPGADPSQATLVWRRLKEGRELEIIQTRQIHDRYVLKDGSAGLVLGSSFGGLGGRFCTILPLPQEDVVALYGILKEIAAR